MPALAEVGIRLEGIDHERFGLPFDVNIQLIQRVLGPQRANGFLAESGLLLRVQDTQRLVDVLSIVLEDPVAGFFVEQVPRVLLLLREVELVAGIGDPKGG